MAPELMARLWIASIAMLNAAGAPVQFHHLFSQGGTASCMWTPIPGALNVVDPLALHLPYEQGTVHDLLYRPDIDKSFVRDLLYRSDRDNAALLFVDASRK